jgi:hypothetical protein
VNLEPGDGERFHRCDAEPGDLPVKFTFGEE